ncbi:MAG: GNAT family N-acetyltransferase [Pseudomonadota bacterium]
MEIRQAKETYFDGIWPILEEVFREGDTFPHSPATSREAAFQYWMVTPTATYVAVDEGEIVGTYYLRPNQPDLGSHVCNAGYIVRAGARNRGIGTAMGKHSLVEARSHGFKAMQFNLVVATNEPSIRIWKKLGFDVVGTLPKAFKHKDLGFVDAFVMYRLL